MDAGLAMYKLVEELFPICRSITGNGLRETLKIIQREIPISLQEVPSGTKVFDWVVPQEWNIRDAYMEDPSGKKIINFKENNLHVMGYSLPVDKVISLEELQEHLYSLDSLPEAIPYVTSYYKERWGFCISRKQRESLVPGQYHVYIDSDLKDGSLTYGELLIKGQTKKEILLSTYVCHPSMANNELSGPVVAVALVKWLLTKKVTNRYSYRILFIPETIGSITYLSRHYQELQKNVRAGFVLTCMGDEKAYSFLPSRLGKTMADRVSLYYLHKMHPEFIRYSYLDRGSDERQYCAPGIDLPVVSVMRSKHSVYPEYHTSFDNMNFISPKGLQDSFNLMQAILNGLEGNRTYKCKCLCEPQLGKRGLYPTLSMRNSGLTVKPMLNMLAYMDGSRDLLEIADVIHYDYDKLMQMAEILSKNNLIGEVDI